MVTHCQLGTEDRGSQEPAGYLDKCVGSGFRERNYLSKQNGEWLREIFHVNLWLPHACTCIHAYVYMHMYAPHM